MHVPLGYILYGPKMEIGLVGSCITFKVRALLQAIFFLIEKEEYGVKIGNSKV